MCRCSGEGSGNPLQYSCLGNPTDREARWSTVHGIAESGITERLTLLLFTFRCCVWFILYTVSKACQVLATCFRNSVNISWIETCLRNVFISTEQIPYKNLNINHRYLQCHWDLHSWSLCHLTALLKGADCFKVCCKAFLLGTLYPGRGCAFYA